MQFLNPNALKSQSSRKRWGAQEDATKAIASVAATSPSNDLTVPVAALNATPLNFPQYALPDDLSYEGILSGAKNFYQGQVQNVQTQATAMSAADQRIQQLMQSTLGRAEATTAAEATAGIPGKQARLDDLLSSINTRSSALEQAKVNDAYAIEGLAGRGQGTPQSIIRGQQARESHERQLQRQTEAVELGKLVGTAELLQGNLETARAAVDRAITLQFSDAEKAVDNELFFYEKNYDRFTQAQKDAADARKEVLVAAQAQIEDQKETEKQKFQMQADAAQAGATQQQLRAIQNAGSLEEASTIATSIVGTTARADIALDRQAKQASIRASQESILNSQQNRLIERAKIGDPAALKSLGISSDPTDKVRVDQKEAANLQKEMVGNDAYKAMQKSKDSIAALKAYERQFLLKGTTSGITSPIDNAKLKTVYNGAVLNLKEFFNLGVLNGPDLSVIEGVLGKPTDQGFVTNPAAKAGANEGLKNMYAQIESSLDDRYLSLRSQYGKYDPSQLGTLQDLDRTYLQSKAEVNPAVSQFLKENPDLPLEDKLQVINSKF